jgi:predicted PurR-regulated permease PerM
MTSENASRTTATRTSTRATAARATATEQQGSNRAFIALLIAVAIVLWLARAVLGPFIVAAVVAYAFSPVVSTAERRFGLPRILVVTLGYLIAFVVVGGLAWLLTGRVISEINQLALSGPNAVATTLRDLLGSDAIAIGGMQITVAEIASQIQARIASVVTSPGDALHVAGEVGAFALEAILALIVTFYFLIDGTAFRDHVVSVLPADHRAATTAVLERIHVVLGKWLRGQIFLIFLVAAVTYLVLGPILHLPYALAIAVITGVLEVIPLVGPLAATAIAGTDAFARGGPSLAAIVIVFYFGVRQIEDQIVMPVVIGRAVHLHPVVTIFAVLVGLHVYGVLGGLLGVPVAAALNVIYRELYQPEETPEQLHPARVPRSRVRAVPRSTPRTSPPKHARPPSP